jgi:base plate wedge protein 53
MADFFKTFPLIEYGDHQSRNVMLRAGVARRIIESYGVFYPYRIRDHERIDTIAHDYYGDSKYAWLVAIANDVYDPYHDWPLSDEDFLNFVVEKYGSFEDAASTVHHYENTDPDVKWWMTAETRAALDPADRIGHDVEVTCLEYEQTVNEDKKTVRLLSRRYAERAYAELKRTFTDDRN